MGEPTSNDPLIVDELRSHIHDILHPNQDRDRRSILCFPVPSMAKFNICLIRVTPSGLYSIHLTKATEPSTNWAFLVSFQGHMRLALPPSKLIGDAACKEPMTISPHSGWEELLQYNSHTDVGIDVKVLGQCPTCQANAVRRPVGVDGTLVGRCTIASDLELRSFSIKNRGPAGPRLRSGRMLFRRGALKTYPRRSISHQRCHPRPCVVWGNFPWPSLVRMRLSRCARGEAFAP